MRIFILMLLALILTASWQQAQAEEVCLDGDTVIGIKNLELLTDQYGIINVDVEFRYATGIDVYGSGLDNLPFDPPGAEEDAFIAMIGINEALEATSPVPSNVGQPGQTAYYIGSEEETGAGEGLVGAAGSENLTGAFWDPCTQANDCLLGVAVLEVNQRFVYADLARAVDGASCDSSTPPGPTFTITPGITGSWYDPERDGEGYNIEIIGSSLEPTMLAYFYTYDDTGNQMWLIGTGPVSGDTATVHMQVTSGTVFGPGFNPDDVVREDWGTVTFIFSSCNAGTAEYDSIMGFGTGTSNIVRLSSVTGLTCP